MDLTALFKASIRTAKTRNKVLTASGEGEIDKNTILGLGPKRKGNGTICDFTHKATEIVKSINKLRDFLMQHRRDYINLNYVMYEASNMTDAERDQIDCDAERFMQTCKEVIKNLNSESRKEKGSQQATEHREAVIHSLETYLKSVCNIYSELKANRVKRSVDKQKLLRLESGYRASKVIKNAEQFDQIKSKLVQPSSDKVDEQLENTDSISNEAKTPLIKQPSLDDKSESSYASTFSFSAEETQLFEQENQQLWEDLNSMVDEVKQIEGKVVEISRLQDIFSERVLEQETQINQISDVTVGTTENIKEGNEELRQAMRKNAGFRLWILFILIVLSFTILFLNWYNP